MQTPGGPDIESEEEKALYGALLGHEDSLDVNEEDQEAQGGDSKTNGKNQCSSCKKECEDETECEACRIENESISFDGNEIPNDVPDFYNNLGEALKHIQKEMTRSMKIGKKQCYDLLKVKPAGWKPAVEWSMEWEDADHIYVTHIQAKN